MESLWLIWITIWLFSTAEGGERQPVALAPTAREVSPLPAAIAAGQKSYVQYCAACHGSHGQGQIGPNLLDAYWIYGDGNKDAILYVIKKGVPAKGMPAWDTLLTAPEMAKITAYIHANKGQSYPDAKAPQGEKYN